MAVSTQTLLVALFAGLATVPLAHASPFPAVTAIARSLGVRDATPNLPHDDKTESSCSWWIDNDGSIPCQNIPSEWGISLDNWLYWNPSLTRDCGNFLSGRSYCVEAPVNAPPPTTTKPTTTKPTSTKTSAVPTGPTNGIETPIPTQIGMISNCDKFYFVQQGDNCAAIATKHGITQAQFVQWNPAVGNDCTGLWSDTYACVHTIGLQTTSTTKKPTTTTSSKPTNGIQTPIPTQTGMVANCDKFHLVESGQSCATIATKYGITQQQIVKWNPAVGSDCTGLWANTYACVHIVGLATTTTTTKKPTTTTTKPTSTGNGIATPTPQQPGMVKNCDKFHLVQSGQTCAKIAAANTITVAKLQEWNTGIGSDCTGLWANAYVCVRTIGYKSATKTKCSTTAKAWGTNKDAALKNVGDWCDGNSSKDGSGGFATAQKKSICFAAPNGENKIQFLARNDFGIGTSLPVSLCNTILKATINGCEKGGEGRYEGWFVDATVTAGKC